MTATASTCAPEVASPDHTDGLRPVTAVRLAVMREYLDWLENHGPACEEPEEPGDRWDGLS
jgi:hypothetical protein